ncbi:STAS domain-containing protein [uncultured Jatrophihabitans sp.]|uniref:STAS domain-containing protein n=1 Tax=uncultured Jatrophihabitans sp. TaxID=1610747 RepID=UPI0035CB6CF1
MDLDVIEDADEDERSVLLVTGSVDFGSRGTLLDAGRQALGRDDVEGLILDLGQVSFLDSTGIGVFVQLAQVAEDGEKSFALRNPSNRVRRVLEVAGLAEQWAERRA